MPVQMTIIGLGQIGASAGLALRPHPEVIQRAGYDKDLPTARRAEKLGAVERTFLNLPASVEKADIVLLSLPLNEIREVLRVIAPALKEGAVVMDTSPVKEPVIHWAAEYLTGERYYVGLTPVLNANYLQTHDSGLEAAREDLFQENPLLIAAPPGTPSAAIKLAADLTRLLGATPLFADIVEVDSLMASTHILPQLISAALVNATVDQPGWLEGRKLAGRPYAVVTDPIIQGGTAAALAEAALCNRENVLRSLDGFIAALQHLRTDIASENPQTLLERVERARNSRQRWWHQRQSADWTNESYTPSEQPSASQFFGRLLGVGRKDKTNP